MPTHELKNQRAVVSCKLSQVSLENVDEVRSEQSSGSR